MVSRAGSAWAGTQKGGRPAEPYGAFGAPDFDETMETAPTRAAIQNVD